MKSKLLFLRIISLPVLVLLLLLVLHWIGTHTQAASDLTGIAAGENIYLSGTALPETTAFLWPDPAIADLPLRGSAPYSDPERDFAGIGAFRWLRNGVLVESGFVPQSFLLPMDNNLFSTDGQSPTQSSGLNFISGRFGDAIHFSLLNDSKLAYPTNGNVNPKEGSIEMWVLLSQDLGKLGNAKYHPRLFSYNIDSERQLYIEISDGRIVLASRNLGQFLTTWPAPPDWHANEWHLVTATWSAIANRQSIYYDCVLQDETNFSELNGSADEFFLGSDEDAASIDGSLDDIRLSRRALNNGEVAAACSRPGPAPNDEVILPSDQFTVGDQITYEYTPCDINDSCDLTVNTNTFVAAPPIGELQPSPQIYSQNTITFTLVLTTQVLADCRWSDMANTPYADMPNTFVQGQGTTHHSTMISGFSDFSEHFIYVRCADLATGRDPDAYQRSTYFRMQSPGEANYPRIASTTVSNRNQIEEKGLASYDLRLLNTRHTNPRLPDQIHQENPTGKILLVQNIISGWPEENPLTSEWLASLPGDPDYNCLIHDASGDLLILPGLDHPIYNLTVAYCRDQLIQSSLAAFTSEHPWQGVALDYDGIYWEGLETSISWISNLIDSNLDGQPDDPGDFDAAYKAGVLDLLNQVRERFPQAVQVANTSDPDLTTWLNGSVFDWQIDAFLDEPGKDTLWSEVLNNLLYWDHNGNPPRLNIIKSSPEPSLTNKYSSSEQIPAAMVTEAAESYQRMRFGLITSLMGDSLFSYDFEWSGPDQSWWYDEYGRNSGSNTIDLKLPPPGYLGQPTSDPFLLVDQVNSPNLLAGGDFESHQQSWNLTIQPGSGAYAELTLDATAGIDNSSAAHIIVGESLNRDSVQFWQTGFDFAEGQDYALSFWAHSNQSRTITIQISKEDEIGNVNVLDELEVSLYPGWQQYHLTGVINSSTEAGKLAFLMGDLSGEVWLDNIQFQTGSLGIWARAFANGLAIINTTKKVQDVSLPTTYCKLNGSQAPLFQARVDNEHAIASAGWSVQPANANQFGETIAVAPGGSFATLDYTPNLAYPGNYEVLIWIAPETDLSSNVTLAIRHANGDSKIVINQADGQVGWHSLGVYSFDAGSSGGVQFIATGDGSVVGDAVKWVSVDRYNDGSKVDQITLQPRDGIILLSSCYHPSLSDFIPLIKR